MLDQADTDQQNYGTIGQPENADEAKVDPTSKRVYQWLNLGSYIVCMILNGTAQSIMPTDLGDISRKYDVYVAPAGYAFSIWGLIYALIGIYVVGAVIPQKCCCGLVLNENILVNRIKWFMPLNFLLNGVWLFLFMADTVATYWISELVILGILATAIYITKLASEEKLNPWEIIGLRIGFAIYAGWLTAATIVGIFIASSASGGLYGPDYETSTGIAALWIGCIFYAAVSIWTKNPVYGLALIWAYTAISIKQVDEDRSAVVTNIYVILGVFAVFLLVLTGLLWKNKLTYKDTDQEWTGLLYNRNLSNKSE